MRGIRTDALIALLSKAPHEFLAVGAEGWLAEEAGAELVPVDFMDLAALHGANALWRLLLLNKVCRKTNQRQ